MNNLLLKISLIISLSGILILLILMQNLSPDKLKIKDISEKNLNQKIEVLGKISGIKNYKDSHFQIITLDDETGKINIIKNNINNLTKNQTILVIGKITYYTSEYKDELQINADMIKLLSLN